ncbi:hypothetical protein Anapl_09745 [Anas platyrhynchos]|uniref:Uncharacterized protein n=1 Tax=Anas platyrhynchos TaxID=8839 RepID=R0KKE3_ANAPL|nr:hypothetical protein Anapl_09745 [Anas platyrhynchos]
MSCSGPCTCLCVCCAVAACLTCLGLCCCGLLSSVQRTLSLENREIVYKFNVTQDLLPAFSPKTSASFGEEATTPSQTPSFNPCTAFASPIPFGHAGSSSSLVHPLRPGCVYKSSAANFRGNLLPSLRAQTFAGCNYLSLSSPRPPSFWFTSRRHTSEHHRNPRGAGGLPGPVLSEQAASGSWVNARAHTMQRRRASERGSRVALLHSLQLGCARLILVRSCRVGAVKLVLVQLLGKSEPRLPSSRLPERLRVLQETGGKSVQEKHAGFVQYARVVWQLGLTGVSPSSTVVVGAKRQEMGPTDRLDTCLCINLNPPNISRTEALNKSFRLIMAVMQGQRQSRPTPFPSFPPNLRLLKCTLRNRRWMSLWIPAEAGRRRPSGNSWIMKPGVTSQAPLSALRSGRWQSPNIFVSEDLLIKMKARAKPRAVCAVWGAAHTPRKQTNLLPPTLLTLGGKRKQDLVPARPFLPDEVRCRSAAWQALVAVFPGQQAAPCLAAGCTRFFLADASRWCLQGWQRAVRSCRVGAVKLVLVQLLGKSEPRLPSSRLPERLRVLQETGGKSVQEKHAGFVQYARVVWQLGLTGVSPSSTVVVGAKRQEMGPTDRLDTCLCINLNPPNISRTEALNKSFRLIMAVMQGQRQSRPTPFPSFPPNLRLLKCTLRNRRWMSLWIPAEAGRRRPSGNSWIMKPGVTSQAPLSALRSGRWQSPNIFVSEDLLIKMKARAKPRAV